MPIDPTKAVEEVASAWKSQPFVIGLQLICIGLMGVFFWDRVESRSAFVGFMDRILASQALRSAQLEHQIEALHEEITNCYRGGSTSAPNSLTRP